MAAWRKRNGGGGSGAMLLNGVMAALWRPGVMA